MVQEQWWNRLPLIETKEPKYTSFEPTKEHMEHDIGIVIKPVTTNQNQ